jgi:hypothetical protein
VTDNNLYLGIPGALSTIVWPKGGLSGPRGRLVSEFTLGSGGRQIWKTVNGKRTYVINYGALDLASFSMLEAFDQGHMGPGPFALLDPGRRNQLTANQSAATSLTNGTDNFTVAGTGGTIASSSALVLRGPRSLLWTLNIAAPASGTVSLDSPTTDWPGIPVASRPYAFGCWVRTQVDASVTLQARLTWYDTSGATLSTSTGNATVCGTAGWTQVWVTASPPASGAYVNGSLAVSGATVSVGAKLYLDQFQLNEGTTVDTAWSPGTGVFPVQVMSLSDAQQWMFPDYRVGPVLTLAEVGV